MTLNSCKHHNIRPGYQHTELNITKHLMYIIMENACYSYNIKYKPHTGTTSVLENIKLLMQNENFITFHNNEIEAHVVLAAVKLYTL